MSDAKHAAQVTSMSLLQRVRANDQQAWARLTMIYRPLVVYWCRKAHCPDNELDDVAQEVFAAAAAGLSGFRRDRAGDTFRGWLRGITRNQVLLYFRRNQGRPQALGGTEMMERIQNLADLPLVSDEDEAGEVRQWYRRAVDHVRGEFEERTWQMFWRCVIDGRSTTAVAEELHVSPASVRQAKSRVLRRMKEEMGELLD